MIFIIDDDRMMAECIAKATGRETQIFADGLAAMGEIAKGNLPEMIFLDILLSGPDGFTFLNEMISYTDLAEIPVVVVSSLDLSGQDLSSYGVVRILSKDTMTPKEIKKYVSEYIK